MAKDETSTVPELEKKRFSSNQGQDRYRSGGDGKSAYRFIEAKFEGETPGMSGYVFQCHSEQRKRGQFKETMGALKTFASTKYVSHIDYLTPFFFDLSEPALIKPTLTSKKSTITLNYGTTKEISSASQDELEEFRLKLKDFINDEKAVKTTKRSLHNVVWGQCSHMLRTKPKGDEDYKRIELDGDVVELLKHVRSMCRINDD